VTNDANFVRCFFLIWLAKDSSIMVPYIKLSLPIVLFKSGCVFRHRRSYVTWNFIYYDIYRQHSIHVSISGIPYSHCILWFPHAIVRHYATLLQSPPPSPPTLNYPQTSMSIWRVMMDCFDPDWCCRITQQTDIQVDTPNPEVAPNPDVRHRRHKSTHYILLWAASEKYINCKHDVPLSLSLCYTDLI